MKKALALVLLVPFLMGNDGGCDSTQPLPTVTYIDLNLPENIRRCPHAPKSPGADATRRQTAEYIAKLYDAWEVCHGNLQDVDRIYVKWKAESQKIRKK